MNVGDQAAAVLRTPRFDLRLPMSPYCGASQAAVGGALAVLSVLEGASRFLSGLLTDLSRAAWEVPLRPGEQQASWLWNGHMPAPGAGSPGGCLWWRSSHVEQVR